MIENLEVLKMEIIWILVNKHEEPISSLEFREFLNS